VRHSDRKVRRARAPGLSSRRVTRRRAQARKREKKKGRNHGARERGAAEEPPKRHNFIAKAAARLRVSHARTARRAAE
jgi:hypothetical protein